MFECLPRLTLHNSRIKRSGFLVPVTQRQAGYVTLHGAVTMTQSWLQYTVSALSKDAKTGHTDIEGEPLPNETESAVYSKLQKTPSHVNLRFWGCRGSIADFQAPLASMSMGIWVASLKFLHHYIELSCSIVSVQSRITLFNHCRPLADCTKLEILNKQ